MKIRNKVPVKNHGNEYFTRKREKLTSINKKLFIIIIIIGLCVAGIVTTAGYFLYSKSTQSDYITKAYSEEFRTKQAVFKVKPITTNVLGQTEDMVYTDIGNFQINGIIKSNKVVVYTDIFGQLQLIDTMTLRKATDYFCYVYSDYEVDENEIELDDTAVTLDYSEFLNDMAEMEKSTQMLNIFKTIGVSVASLFFILVILFLITKRCIKVYATKGSEFEALDIAIGNKVNKQKAYEQGLKEFGEEEDTVEEYTEHLVPQSKKELKQRKKDDIKREKEEAKLVKENEKRDKREAKMRLVGEGNANKIKEVGSKDTVKDDIVNEEIHEQIKNEAVRTVRPNGPNARPQATKKESNDTMLDIQIEEDEILDI